PGGASRPDGVPAGGTSGPDRAPAGGASGPRAASATRADGANESPDSPTLRLVRFDLPDAVESNLALMREGLARMADLSGEMLMVAMNAAQIPEELDTDRGRCETVDRTLEALCTQTSQAVSVAVQSVCTPGQAVRLQQQLHIAVELRNIGTDIKKLLSVLARSRRKGYRPHKASEEELFDITARVLDFLRYNSDFLSGRLEQQDPEVADSMEQAVDTARDRLRKHSRKTMEKKSSADVRGELAFMQAVGYLEHIGDRCLRISQTITELNVRSQ
ncbi:MAG: PhoU domain-containing protein, partial [Spirochaetota bacterium]